MSIPDFGVLLLFLCRKAFGHIWWVLKTLPMGYPNQNIWVSKFLSTDMSYTSSFGLTCLLGINTECIRLKINKKGVLFTMKNIWNRTTVN